jgi:hypothetical protein
MTIAVTTPTGRRFVLGAAVRSALMRDPRFLDEYLQIVSYWQRAAGLPARSFPTPGPLMRGLVHQPAVTSPPASHALGLRRARPGDLMARPGPYIELLIWLGRLAAAGIAALGVMLMFFGLRDIGPAWAAQLGHGTPFGSCGRNSGTGPWGTMGTTAGVE